MRARLTIVGVLALALLTLAACSGTYTLPGSAPPEGVSYYKVTRTGGNVVVEPWTPPATPPTPTPTPTPTPPPPTPTPTPTPTVPPPTPPPSSDPVAAINRAVSGQTVVVPAGTFAGDVRVPNGVTVVGQGMNASHLTGSLSWGSNTIVRDLAAGSRGASHAPAVYSTSNTRFERVRFYGGGNGGGVIGWNNRAVAGLVFDGCEFARNYGVWSSSGGSGLLWFAVDTGQGTVIRDVTIVRCHFGVSNGTATGSPTYGIVFWQSEEGGSGYWGDITIEGNVFEVTGEFTLDFDGLAQDDRGHNDVIIRGNVIKGAGLKHDGINPSWPYGICVEPTRFGTVIENNTIGRCAQSPMKFTKDASETVFRNNTIDVRTENGVALVWPDYFRTVNVYDGWGNVVTGNRILLPATPTPSSRVINDEATGTVISGNTITRQ